MKRVLCAFVAIVLAFTLSSCEKESKELTSLSGTSWTGGTIEEDIPFTLTIKFTSDACSLTMASPVPGVSAVLTGTYNFIYPQVFMNFEGQALVGKIAEDNLSMTADGVVFLKD